MFVLDYRFQVRPYTEFADLVPKVDVDPEELDMTKCLIETKTAQTFDMAAYKDTNTEQLKQLIEANVQGKEIVAPPVPEQVQVLNLMDALKEPKKMSQLPSSQAKLKGEAKAVELSGTPTRQPWQSSSRKLQQNCKRVHG